VPEPGNGYIPKSLSHSGRCWDTAMVSAMAGMTVAGDDVSRVPIRKLCFPLAGIKGRLKAIGRCRLPADCQHPFQPV
jgi:hypothetical protein